MFVSASSSASGRPHMAHHPQRRFVRLLEGSCWKSGVNSSLNFQGNRSTGGWKITLFFMGKSMISMAIFNGYVSHYQRVPLWKRLEFVTWDDELHWTSQFWWKNIKHVPVTTNQNSSEDRSSMMKSEIVPGKKFGRQPLPEDEALCLGRLGI